MRFLVAFYDEHGVGRLIGPPNDFDTKEGAERRIQALKDKQFKEHKLDYRAIEYECSLLETMRKNNIVT